MKETVFSSGVIESELSISNRVTIFVTRLENLRNSYRYKIHILSFVVTKQTKELLMKHFIFTKRNLAGLLSLAVITISSMAFSDTKMSAKKMSPKTQLLQNGLYQMPLRVVDQVIVNGNMLPKRVTTPWVHLEDSVDVNEQQLLVKTLLSELKSNFPDAELTAYNTETQTITTVEQEQYLYNEAQSYLTSSSFKSKSEEKTKEQKFLWSWEKGSIRKKYQNHTNTDSNNEHFTATETRTKSFVVYRVYADFIHVSNVDLLKARSDLYKKFQGGSNKLILELNLIIASNSVPHKIVNTSYAENYRLQPDLCDGERCTVGLGFNSRDDVLNDINMLWERVDIVIQSQRNKLFSLQNLAREIYTSGNQIGLSDLESKMLIKKYFEVCENLKATKVRISDKVLDVIPGSFNCAVD